MTKTHCFGAFFIITGELAALGAAFLWALASILFADIGRYIRAINLNLLKGVFASCLMLIALSFGTLLDISELHLNTIISMSPRNVLLLFLSGVIGIGAGDTAYFACLQRIGPQKGLMLESTAPIIAALLALLFLQEHLPSIAWLGILIATSGVILVVRRSKTTIEYNTTISGISFGILAAVCQATGLVMSRQVLLSEQIEPLASGLVRLAAALLIIIFWLAVRKLLNYRSANHQSVKTAFSLIAKHNLMVRLLGAIVLGTFFAIWLMQISVKFTNAGIAQTLLATCPLFGMLIGFFMGQKQPLMVWIGLVLGILGIVLLFLPG